MSITLWRHVIMLSFLFEIHQIHFYLGLLIISHDSRDSGISVLNTVWNGIVR